MQRRDRPQALGRCLALATGVGVLAACAPADRGSIWDPYEAENRAVHAANRSLDALVFGGGDGKGVGAVPAPLRTGVVNLARNLDQPLAVANNLMQFRLGDAAHNTVRFLLNSTLGLMGVLDIAKDLGLEPRPTDFGETLFVWGVPEGAYVELPLFGPSTERDALGLIVDKALNPMRFVLPRELGPAATTLGFAGLLGARAEAGDLVADILGESADSYAQIRLLYLQNRRFRLGDTGFAADFDPYEDPYAE
ncbi:MAG: VacJ family lipoprotein [Rhodobacteraceae bacterium]|nr:VacJ family lipoprotein [Paracoccaceae bacterium]